MSKNKIMCCSVCKQDNISWRVWADELTNVTGSCEDKFVYCDNCEDETTAIFKEDEDEYFRTRRNEHEPVSTRCL
jgi:hypothetical protein